MVDRMSRNPTGRVPSPPVARVQARRCQRRGPHPAGNTRAIQFVIGTKADRAVGSSW